MSVEKVTTVSWFSRLRQSFGGILFGLLLVVGMVVLLFWNEGRAVQTARSLAEGAGLVVSVEAARIDPANDGRLIHVSGPVATAERLSDTGFGISATGLRLSRSVEMLQWIESARTETKQNLGGSETQVTTYTYKLDWDSRHHDSSRFEQPDGHGNPPMALASSDFRVDRASLGAFSLDGNIVGRVGGARALPLQPEHAEGIQRAVGTAMKVSVVDGAVYLGADPARPRLGDYRVRYTIVPLDTISVVGRQAGDGIAAYRTRAGDALLMVRNGAVSAADMFEAAATGNAMLTWILRIAGLIFLIVGFSAVLGPLPVIASVVPFLGSIVGAGTGLVATILGIIVGTITIAAAWLFYRPLTALLILAIGFAVVFAIRKLAAGRREAAAQAPAA